MMTLIPISAPLDLIPSIAAVAAACVYQGAHPTLGLQHFLVNSVVTETSSLILTIFHFSSSFFAYKFC